MIEDDDQESYYNKNYNRIEDTGVSAWPKVLGLEQIFYNMDITRGGSMEKGADIPTQVRVRNQVYFV